MILCCLSLLVQCYSDFKSKLSILFQGPEALEHRWPWTTVLPTLVFCVVLRLSVLCFSSNFVTSLLNSDPLSHWNTFGYLKTPPSLYIVFNTNETPHLLSWTKGSSDLVSWWNINTCQHVLICASLKDIMGHIKPVKLTLLIRFCNIVMRVIYFLRRWYMNLLKCLFC